MMKKSDYEFMMSMFVMAACIGGGLVVVFIAWLA